MTTTSTASQSFYIVQVGGGDDFGTRVTLNSWGEYDMLEDLTGISAPLGVVLIKKRLSATWAGYLNSVNGAVIPGMVVAQPVCTTTNTVTEQTLAFGGRNLSFSMPLCIGNNLSITGRSNQKIQFSMGVEGDGVVTPGTLTAGVVLPTFYPMELATCVEGDLLEFTFNLATGLWGVYYADGTQVRGDVGERMKVATLELVMTSAGGNTVGAAAEAAVDVGPFTITVAGTCTHIADRDVDGIHGIAVTIRGEGATPYSLA